MSDHITTRQSTVIPATVTSAAEGRGGRGRRKAATVACAALGLSLIHISEPTRQ